MPEISTKELYCYRSHRTLQELPDYRRLRRHIMADGEIKEPVELVTDGRHVFLQEGHKRLMIAIELGIPKLAVTITRRPFSRTRRMKFGIRPELAALLAPAQEPAPTS
ncbi:hypothetical protein [Pseudomonas sp.]|uniref:hypothetical protein n=1 Tax=Pseudomonas sp. TaxID=306 RepID=UPI00261B6DEE|nr:hypothetical protein [Pseudomonas sp.]